jgi:group II intron reverse transcriptase/maturase
VDADVSGFFDIIPKGQLQEVIRQRVNDGGIIRLIGKWLNAGVMEGEEWYNPETGTPQGGVISPLLANIYLHEVLDKWYEQEVKPRMRGRSFLVRYADDFIIGCELESDARRIMEVLPKRFGRYGLTIHATKTKVVKFSRPRKEEDGKGNGTYEFLGFTHYWARTRKGAWAVKRKTSGKRLRRARKRVWEWCRKNRHEPMMKQWKTLRLKLRGHYQYYGIRGNYASMNVYYEHVKRTWFRWLRSRGGKKPMTWERYNEILDDLGWLVKIGTRTDALPKPRIVHSI